ncbi:MAG: hypothetical protein JF593_03895 [Novosphingobium sp.]|nr:hypothetical protein [Novosphingobium sp.]
MPKPSRAYLVAMLPLALTACAAAGDYPSLARRPGERVTGSAPPVAPAVEPSTPAPPPSASLATRLDQLVVQARGAHQRFVAAQPRTERLAAAARGAAMGSDNWSVASIALGELESLRSQAMIALADLDALHVETTIAAAGGSRIGDAAAVVAARQQVITLVGSEDDVLARLRADLRG